MGAAIKIFLCELLVEHPTNERNLYFDLGNEPKEFRTIHSRPSNVSVRQPFLTDTLTMQADLRVILCNRLPELRSASVKNKFDVVGRFE